MHCVCANDVQPFCNFTISIEFEHAPCSASKSLKFNLNVSVPLYWWKKRSLSDQIITSWIKNHAMTSHILTATKLVLTSCHHGWWRNQSLVLFWLGCLYIMVKFDLISKLTITIIHLFAIHDQNWKSLMLCRH